MLLYNGLFTKLKQFSARASSVHMLDLARVNAWPHLSARASQEVMEKVPPSAPCSFCLKELHQTSVHCLASEACSAFQDLKVGRHTDIVHKLVEFLTMRTSFSCHFHTSFLLNLPSDLKCFDLINVLTTTLQILLCKTHPMVMTIVLVLDVTVVSPSRMAHAHSSN